MTERDEGGRGGKAPRAVSLGNANRFSVAVFSKVTVVDSSAELRELARLVADLAEALASAVASDETTEMRRRARALHHRLNG